MKQLLIYGASDDLIELEGAIRDEYNVYEPGQLILRSEGEMLVLDYDYGRDGTWVFTPRPDEGAPAAAFWNIRISFETPAPAYSQLLTIDVPDDLTVELVEANG